MNSEDTTIVRQIKESNYRSFQILFEKYYGRLCAYAFEIVKNKEASKDVVQELFIKLWNDRHKLEIQNNISAYLFRACKNSSLNYLRKENSRARMFEHRDLPTHEINRDFLEEEEFIAFVNECINELPERSKQVFMLSRFEDLKQKEIAEKLNISVKTIKNQIWKSLQYLRSCLELKDVNF